MPPSLAIGAFVLGAVLLLISLVRGNFKLFGAEVSGTAGGFARIIAFLAGVTLIVTGFLKDGPVQNDAVDRADPVSIGPAPNQPVSPREREPAPQDEPAPVKSSVDETPAVQMEWRIAQQEIIAYVASLPDQEKMAALSLLATGQDVYGIYVRLTNVGSVPVDVSPRNVRLSYNGTQIPLHWVDDQRFLRPARLQPNRFTEGMLTFTSFVTVAGAVLQAGRLSYDDPGIRVTFGQ